MWNPGMPPLLSPLREAVRALRHPRRFPFLAALCAALGVLAFGTVGALLDAAFLQPLPFPGAHRLQRVWMAEPQGNSRVDLSVPEAVAVEERVRAFDSVAWSARIRPVAVFADGAARLRGEAVSANYFATLGLRPALGRLFHATEANEPVVVLSHALWMSRFGGDPAAIGQAFPSGSESWTVIGVLPSWFHGAIEHDEVELWVPWTRAGTPAERADRSRRHVWLIGRLATAATVDSARAEIAALSAALHAEDSLLGRDWQLRLEPLGANWREGLRNSGGLLGVAGVVLLIVGLANAAALLAVRAAARRHELAVRAVLGARPRELACQLLYESVAVVSLGGVVGLALAWPLLRVFLAIYPDLLPPYVALSPNPVAMAWGSAITLLVGAAAGWIPARAAFRTSTGTALRAGGRSTLGRGGSTTSPLVAVQLAVTLVLLVGASLVLRSYAALASSPLGFDPQNILCMGVTFSRLDIPADGGTAALVERLRQGLQATPGVASVGFASPTLPPWDGWRPRLAFGAMSTSEGIAVGGHGVDRALFDTLGIDLVAGRLLDARDVASNARVAVVSEHLAERLGGGSGALGQSLRFAPGDDVDGEFTVVGVVANVAWDGRVETDSQRFFGLGEVRDDVYLPLVPGHRIAIAVRAEGDPRALERAARAAVAAVVPSSPQHWVWAMSDQLTAETRSPRFLALVVNSFATAATVLCGAGLFGFLATAVAARRREVGLRAALGATPVAIGSLVLRMALRLLLPALALATAGVTLLQPLLRSALLAVAPHDWSAISGALAVLLVTALLAVWLPLSRALRVDPAEALRQD
jgi:putative ABC transport system permease protein